MKPLYQTERTLILHSPAEGKQPPLLIKVLNTPHPTTAQIEQFYTEWNIAKKLDIPSVRKVVEKTQYQGKPALRLVYIEGQTLKAAFLKEDTIEKVTPAFDPKQFLEISIQIVDALDQIHQQKIIHKDICPHNILIEEETQLVKIIDFGLATSLNLKTTYLGNPERIQGNLNYISPEQTGRMNRTLDYRSDLYSLGVTLFELLTGKLPFEKEDPLELVHCHLAIEPVFPLDIFTKTQQQNPVLQVLSRIILKLLNKNAEDRYQSAFGLKADLETCLTALENSTVLHGFQAGRSDFSKKFQIPQRLYGRTKELAVLNNTYQSISGGRNHLLLVSGYSGVGKSALVYEIHKPLTENRGYFIEGKFDQFQRNIPYYAWIQAFDNFVQLLLTENPVQLENWKTQFLSRLKGQGKVLTNLLPSFEKIIGPQAALIELPPKENQNRFNTVFTNFVKTIAQKEHPLFIFIDDWQWTDIPSLDLLEKLLLDVEIPYLLITGAYRNNEVTADHAFANTLEKIKKQGHFSQEIQLENLQEIHINQLLADTLKCALKYCQPLSQLIYAKTKGNAFFLRQMLQSLYEKDAIQLKYDTKIGMRWDWDMSEIEGLKITDNVVELMVEKAQQLPENTQKVLELAACIGTLFPLSILSLIYQKSEKATYQDLRIALEEGLIVPVGEEFTFSHDRIQQAIYSLIPDKEKEGFHYKIGQLLLKYQTKEQAAVKVFDIVNQLNFGIRFLSNATEKIQLAELNLKAGIQAKRSIAYDSALHYLKIGQSLLITGSWEKQYELTFGIYRHLAETEALCMNFKKAQGLFQFTFDNTSNDLHKVEIIDYQLWVLQIFGVSKSQIEMALNALAICGFNFREEENSAQLVAIQNEPLIRKFIRNPSRVLDGLQEMKDPMLLMATKIFSRLAFIYALQVDRGKTYELFVLTGIHLFLNKGKNENLPTLLAHFCSILAMREKYKAAGLLTDVALEIADSYSDFHGKPQFLNRTGLWGLLYKTHLKKSYILFEKGIQIGQKNGNIVGGLICGYDILMHQIYEGKPISKAVAYAEKLEIDCNEMGFSIMDLYVKIDKYLILFLNKKRPEYQLKDSFIEDNGLDAPTPRTNYSWLYTTKIQQDFWIENYKEGLLSLLKHKDLIDNTASNIKWADHFFYLALTIIALQKYFSKKEKKLYEQELKDCRRKIRLMSEACPDNFLHKHLLIEAELAKLESKGWQPAQLYQQAIQAARKYEFTHIEGLSNELCAKFWHEQSQFSYAKIHFQQAHQCYERWEAFTLSKKIVAAFPEYFEAEGSIKNNSNSSGSTYELDLESLLKAGQILSSEIVLSNLIAKMLPIVIESAGAEKGILIAYEAGTLQVLAQGKAGAKVTAIAASKNKLPAIIPIDIVHFVAHTKEALVLEAAFKASQFANDWYVQTEKPQSVLCFPIFRKETISHLIYLENNLATGVFTEERIKILTSLSAQIGISMENAALYNDLSVALNEQVQIKEAYSKFVPHSFLKTLGHESILDIRLGDQIQTNCSILFSDIRAYTNLSETLNPAENFNFLNAYLKRVGPAIRQNEGFVSQYFGDGIMALFLNSPEDAVKAAIAMQQNLQRYNAERVNKNRQAIKIGVGIHTGSLMLGVLGIREHLQATVVSDAVNTAARLEGLTKHFQAGIIISEAVFKQLNRPDDYCHRFLGKVQVKGKSEIVAIYEVFDKDIPTLKKLKLSANSTFQKGLDFYFKKDFIGAITQFKKALEIYPNAPIIQNYFQKSAELITQQLPQDWTGAEVMSEK